MHSKLYILLLHLSVALIISYRLLLELGLLDITAKATE